MDLQSLRSLTNAIDAVLPQTQCRRCGYDACRPYAEAVARGEAINRCPPGGAQGIALLAQLTGRPVVPLDETCGSEHPLEVALIDPSRCIGCVLCIKACPVDAIAGAFKRLHTVIEQDCTGCELCIPACPVDCIQMVAPTHPDRPRDWSSEDANRSRLRFERHQTRLQQAVESVELETVDSDPDESAAPDLLAEALRRARERRSRTTPITP